MSDPGCLVMLVSSKGPLLPIHSWVHSSSGKLNLYSPIGAPPHTFSLQYIPTSRHIDLWPWSCIQVFIRFMTSYLYWVWFYDLILNIRVEIKMFWCLHPSTSLSVKIHHSTSEQVSNQRIPSSVILGAERNCTSHMYYFAEFSFCFGDTDRDLSFSFA